MPKHCPFPAACAALLPLTLAGCGGGGSNGGSSPSSASAPADPPSASAALPNGLTATLSESAATVHVGESVVYTLVLTNSTSQAIGAQQDSGCGVTLSLDGAALDIFNAAGQNVNTPTTDCSAVSAPVSVTVAPGQSVSCTYDSGAVFTAAGRYSATATVTLPTGASGTPQSTTLGPLAVTVQ